MRYLLILVLLITVATNALAENGHGWSPWYNLDDGGLNGIEFSHKNDCSPGGTAVCNLQWRFSSGYETPVEIEYTIAWESGGPQKRSERVKIQPGINVSDAFTVKGSALDEVMVRLISDKKILAEARKEVTAELKRQEDERKRREEDARKAELARKAEQARQEKLAQAAALPYTPGEAAEVTQFRDETARRIEAIRRLELQREEEKRQEERIAEERRQEREREQRAEEERQAQISRDKEEKKAQTRRDEERQARERREKREAQEEEDRQATSQAWADLGRHIQQQGAEMSSTMADIDRQTNAAIKESNRVLAAQAAERERARTEREEREADRRRDAERDRVARADAQRNARANAANAQPELPKYLPQVVVIPSTRQTCPPGSSPARHANGEYVTIPPTAYCVNDPQGTSGQGSAQEYGSGSAGGASGTAAGQTTGDLADTSAAPKTKKIEWGPIQPEALAICRQSTKTKKWECNGALDNQIIVDEPTLESALARQHCAGGIWAAGGPIIEGTQWDTYRCGHSLGHGDYDIVKRYGLTSTGRSYLCPKYQPSDGRCSTIYDGQDKR